MSTQAWPENLIEARRFLLRNHSFYGMPILGTDTEFVDDLPTAATDGKSIFLNPKFIHRMPIPHLATILAHESIHVICSHPDLMAQGKWPDGAPLDPAKFNIAADAWINGNLAYREGFQFPANITPILDHKWDGMTIRQIYDSLPNNNGGSGGNGNIQGKGGISGADDIIPHRLTPEEVTENRMKVRQAYEAARSMGKVPAWAEQFIGEIKNPKLDYRDLLKSWLSSTMDRQAVSYRHLSKRYLPDLYAPILTGETFGTLAVGLDTSGSVWAKAPEFLSEFNGILSQLSPVNALLLPFDTEIKQVDEFAQGETIEARGGYRLYGGGGTDFRCVFNHLAGKHIDALIMLTDMYGTFPEIVPPYPVIWVSVGSELNAPFGTVIHAEIGEE